MDPGEQIYGADWANSGRSLVASVDGHLVRQELAAGFGKMITRIATQAEAEADTGPAPEVLIENESSPASDIYSIGVLLYFMVTGQHPVAGTQRQRVDIELAEG